MAATGSASPTLGISVRRFLVPDLPTAEELIPYLRRIDEARWYSNFGPLVRELEDELRRILTKADSSSTEDRIYLTTLVSGYHALEVALRLVGIKPGKKVLVPAVTFAACPLAVQHAGGEAILSDIDPVTWTLTPEIARAVASRVQVDAVMPVALYGVPIPVSPWEAFTRETGIAVVIDAAAAMEVQQIPKMGLVAHSLHATKPFGVGEGGVLACRNPDLIEKARQYTNFGTSERICQTNGSNAKMSEYHAAVGCAQANRWGEIKRRRRDLLKLYEYYLAPHAESLSLQPAVETSVVSLFVLFLRRPIAETVLHELSSRGVATHRSYLPPLHRHPNFAMLAISSVEGKVLTAETPAARRHGHMTHSENLMSHLIGVPFHSFMSESDVISIVNELNRHLQVS